MSHNPYHLYSLNIKDISDINDTECNDTECNNTECNDTECNNNKIINFFWAPDPNLINKLMVLLKSRNITDNIIDIGCGPGSAIFPYATHILDFNETNNTDKISIKLDLDFDKFSQPDRYFKFIYCRHTLEDIQNPINAFNEFIRISKMGFIETPSPLVEIMKGVDLHNFNMNHSGYIHHRYIIWSDFKTNTLYFLPKYPLVEHITINELLLKKYHHLLNNYSIYWNNYYFWDVDRKPNIVIYRNDINFTINNDYARLLNEAINSSFH